MQRFKNILVIADQALSEQDLRGRISRRRIRAITDFRVMVNALDEWGIASAD
jgi:hypothetical protein